MEIELPHNPNITYFAQTNYRGTNKIFGIQRPDRRQHMYILGKSGMGKSTLLSNMIIQDIRNGNGLCVVDPHGELVEDILGIIPKNRLDDVVYFNPADVDYHVGFNVLEVHDERYKHLVASGIMGIFTKIWANVWSSRMEYILNNCILALIDTPETTLLGIQRILVDKGYRQKIVSNIKDPVVRTFWVHEYEAWQDKFRNEAIAPIQNKVGQFLSSAIIRNILGQKKSTINISEIMNSKKIFLVNLSKGRVGEDNSALLGAMIITKIQLATMERVKIAEASREDFYLYVDEFQNFVTDSFAAILSEARKYRLNLIIAHQYIAQLENEGNATVRDAVFGNVGTMMIGRVGAADAAFLETEFTPELTPEDFVSLPNHNIYLKLLVNGMTTRPFSARTLPPIAKIEKNEQIESYITENSRKLYHRPRTAVEKEIASWSNDQDEGPNVEVDEDGLGTDGKYRVPCSFDDCDKIAVVPFKPDPKRPVYCRDCISKLKNGEKKPVQNNSKAETKQHQASVAGLAALGLEFSTKEVGSKTKSQERSRNTSSDNTRRSQGRQAAGSSSSQARRARRSEQRNKRPEHTRQDERRQTRTHADTRQKSTANSQRKRVRRATDDEKQEAKIQLGALIQSALSGPPKEKSPRPNKSEAPSQPSQAPSGAGSTPKAKQTISLKDLAAQAAVEETIDLTERYKPIKPHKPKFDPSKQAGEENISALQAALAKAKASGAPAQPELTPTPTVDYNEQVQPVQRPSLRNAPESQATSPEPPSTQTSPAQAPHQNQTTPTQPKEAPEGLLKHILADND